MSDIEEEFLSAIKKMEIVSSICALETTSYSAAHSIDIPYGRVRNWVARGRKRGRLHTHGGRPKALDEESIETIRQYMQENANLTDNDLKAKIRAEHQVSSKRKYIDTTDDDTSDGEPCKKLSRMTIRKYVRYFGFP